MPVTAAVIALMHMGKWCWAAKQCQTVGAGMGPDDCHRLQGKHAELGEFGRSGLFLYFF